jgi:hypothetical protein
MIQCSLCTAAEVTQRNTVSTPCHLAIKYSKNHSCELCTHQVTREYTCTSCRKIDAHICAMCTSRGLVVPHTCYICTVRLHMCLSSCNGGCTQKRRPVCKCKKKKESKMTFGTCANLSENHGRNFWSCKKCNFFEWA